MESNWILLRGLTRGNGHWGEFPKLMQNAGYNIELMEIPGNGTQFKVKTPTDVKEVILDIKNRSHLLRERKQVNICGVSLGGMVALKWAELYPEDLKSVVTVNSSLNQFSKFYERLRTSNYIKIIRCVFERNPFLRELLVLKMTSNRSDLIEENALIYSEFSSRHQISILNLFRQLILANNIEISSSAFKKVTILCSKQDRFVSSNCSAAIAKNLGYQIHIHPTAGHDLPLDDPMWLLERLTVSLN